MSATSIQDFKRHFYSGEEFISFNNAGMGLIPDVNRDTAIHWLQRYYAEAALCAVESVMQSELTREKLAKFLGADVEEVAFFTTTASALSQAAFGIKFAPGDEILTWDQEYPSNFYPWRVAAERSGAKLIQVESENWQTPAQKILDRVTQKTRAIAVSWVQYQTGAVTDLQFLSKELQGTGIWLVADVIQGAGVRPFDFHKSGFDIICGGSHKWLCSSFGAAFMLVKHERLAELSLIEVGASTYGDPNTPKSFSIQPKTTAAKFEAGSKPFIEILAMGASLDLFLNCGVENIFAESSRLANRFRSGLATLNLKCLSPEGPIVTFLPTQPQDLESICNKLDAMKVSYARRASGVRVSFHAYNTEAQVDRVLGVLGR